MYFRDHPLPHFRVVTSSRREAQLRLSDLSILAGQVPSAVLVAARAWAAANRNVLRENWDALHPG